jgi:D-3-phosphoglycerate dehydrogenase
MLVNTARADLVDETALLRALDDNHIAHASLDVFPDEPLAADNPYVFRGDVTLTAHAAYMTEDAYEELWSRAMSVLSLQPRRLHLLRFGRTPSDRSP